MCAFRTYLMKIKKDNKIIELENYAHLFVCVILDSLKREKALNYHDTLLTWQESFENFKIPILIVTPDDDTFLHGIKTKYHSNMEYAQNIDSIESLDCLIEKNVYGKKYTLICSSMFIMHNHKNIYSIKQINNKQIKSLYIKAVEKKIKLFLKNLKNSVDIPSNLW